MKKMVLILLYFLLGYHLLFFTQASANTKASADPPANELHFLYSHHVDLINLEYDDAPYPGRTRLGQSIAPRLRFSNPQIVSQAGLLIKHLFSDSQTTSPPYYYSPFISMLLLPTAGFNVTVGHFLYPQQFPATIEDPFFHFEKSPATGIKIDYRGINHSLMAFLDWQQIESAQQREKFTTGLAATAPQVTAHTDLQLLLHYIHEGGQRYKHLRSTRIKQNIVLSPGFVHQILPLTLSVFTFFSYQQTNFETPKLGRAISASLKYRWTKSTEIAYLYWFKDGFEHPTTHRLFSLNRKIQNRFSLAWTPTNQEPSYYAGFKCNFYLQSQLRIDFQLTFDLNKQIAISH